MNMNRFSRTLAATVVIAAGLVTPVVAQSPAAGQDLMSASLEDLMQIRVTSAARKSQRAEDVPAAVYVITRKDILRSGLTSLPELLRLVPGVQVAQVNANKWAVSIRGFSDLYSNKLLVLVDGRSVYSRTFSGVFWDMQDLLVSDIDRIEVIRGAGGAVWGANAVNGVINVITRPATETIGLSASVSTGTFERGRVGVRYGGKLGDSGAYRVFSQWSGYGDGPRQSGSLFDDRWHALTTGFRIDGSRGTNAMVAQGHFTTNETRPGWFELPNLEPGVTPTTDGVSHAHETSILGRWTRPLSEGTVFQVQGYYTDMDREEGVANFTERTSDVDAQYQTRLGPRHGVMLGAGYRHVDLAADKTLTIELTPQRTETLNAFLQDEIAVRKDVSLILGSKLEHDTLGGLGLLPSARLMWQVSPTQRAWTAVSRARRTPAFIDRSVRVNFGVLQGPGLPLVVGYKSNPDYRSEKSTQVEVGYRIVFGSTVSADVTAFTGSYDVGVTQPLEPTLELTPAPAHIFAGQTTLNLMNVRTRGAEFNVHWTPLPTLQLESSYSLLDLSSHVDAAKVIGPVADVDGNAPKHQWQLRGTTAIRPNLHASALLSHIARLRVLDVAAYTRLDAGLEYSVNSRLTAAVAGQNLLSAAHREFASPSVFLASTMPRGVRIDLRWQF
jgi:iron complex outermembrane receptor protein